MPKLILRLDQRISAFGADKLSLYQAALDMAAWADEQGFFAIQFSEHHGAEDSYLPSPLLLAAAVAARTSRVRLRFTVLLLPFYHPLRLAEDLAVLDIISNGRVEVVFGAGYVPFELEMFAIEPGQRGQLMERGIALLRQAWTGDTFLFEGRPARVTPTPVQQPHPPIGMGGNSNAAARRAARLCDEFFVLNPALYEVYRQEKIALGRADPGPWVKTGSGFFVCSEEPAASLEQMAPYILHELNSYGDWKEAASQGRYRHRKLTRISDIESSGAYPVLPPGPAIDYARSLGPEGMLILHPLISGLPPAQGWAQLEYFAAQVLPQLAAD